MNVPDTVHAMIKMLESGEWEAVESVVEGFADGEALANEIHCTFELRRIPKFALGQVLSITTGNLLCNIDGLYAILNHMTGDNLYTHQLPRACRECAPWLLRQHPQLADVNSDDITPENYQQQLAELELKYGKELPVSPIPADDHAQKDPVAELKNMVGEERVIVIEGDEVEP